MRKFFLHTLQLCIRYIPFFSEFGSSPYKEEKKQNPFTTIRRTLAGGGVKFSELAMNQIHKLFFPDPNHPLYEEEKKLTQNPFATCTLTPSQFREKKRHAKTKRGRHIHIHRQKKIYTEKKMNKTTCYKSIRS